jgi:leucyl-tRNA synthetase
MRDAGLVPSDEPFRRLLCQGMVLADSFYRLDEKGGQQWISPTQVKFIRDDKGRMIDACHATEGYPVVHDGMSKMSKSRNNGIDPQVIIDRYGADTVRLFIMFAAPPAQSLEWSESGVEGASRFLRRLWRLVHQLVAQEPAPALDKAALTSAQKELRNKTHKTIQKITHDYEQRYGFNTAIAACMELCNNISRHESENGQCRAVVREALEAVVLLLAPVTPHVCHALWQHLGHETAVVNARWPEFDPTALESETCHLVVQVNGKVRGKIEVPTDADEAHIKTEALNNENVQRSIEGKPVRKCIVVPGKLVSIVVG